MDSDKEMEMVRHQAKREERKRGPLFYVAQRTEEAISIFGIVNYNGAAVPPTDNVENGSWNVGKARFPRHTLHTICPPQLFHT